MGKIVQFSAFAKNKIAAGDVEAMYKKAHAEIRAEPTRTLPKKAKKAGAKIAGDQVLMAAYSHELPGFNKEKGGLNAKVHRDRIFGVHVAKYMKEIEEIKKSNPDEKIVQFSAFTKNEIAAGDVEAMYKKAH